MSLLKSDDFLADVEQQFEWYAVHAPGEIAERYLDAVEATCLLLERHPLLGPKVNLTHPRLRDWRFMMVFRPFQKHILFYEAKDGNVVLRRSMHGHRDLPRRLIKPPEAA